MSNQLSLVELPSYSAIDVTGADAAKFLQGQLTINVDTPTESQSCLAALCNPKGRIVSLFHIVVIEQGFRLVMPKSLIDASLSHLKKYGVFFKVEIVESAIFGLVGVINFSADILTAINNSAVLKAYQLNEHQMAFIALSSQDNISQLSTSLKVSIKQDPDIWFSALARHKVCWLTEQSSEEFLPHNLDLPDQNAVDFKKGCFTGQEVIARMHYKGKLKQHLRLLKSSQYITLKSGEKIRQDDKLVGEVVCSVTTKKQQTLALGLIKDSADKEIPLSVNSGELFEIQDNLKQ